MAEVTKIPAGDLQVGDHYAGSKKLALDGKHYPITAIRDGETSRRIELEGHGNVRPRRTTEVWVMLESNDPRLKKAGNGGGTPDARADLKQRMSPLEGEKPSEAAMRISGNLLEDLEKLQAERNLQLTNVEHSAIVGDREASIRVAEVAAGGHRGLEGDALKHYLVTGEDGGDQARNAQAQREATSGRHTPRGPKPGSMTTAMVEVLKGKRKPMTAKEIWAEIQARGLWASPKGKTPDATIGAKLSTEAKKGGLFERVAPGQYKLRARQATKGGN